jgi:hexosaminidase
MKVVTRFFIFLLPVFTAAEYLLGIPTVPFTASGSGTFDASQIEYIIADAQYEDVSDLNGSTLIPPTLYGFATTFAKDLSEVVSKNISVVSGSESLTNSIFLTLGDQSTFLDAAGRPTSEGYSLDVNEEGIVITGASPLGVWWGTRTILQQFALNNGELELGSSSDSPGWATRGVMVSFSHQRDVFAIRCTALINRIA